MKWVHRTVTLLAVCGLMGNLLTATVAAQSLSNDEIQGVYEWPNWVTGTACGSVGSAASDTTNTSSPSAEQIANAQIVIGIAKTDNLGQQGALIGLMTSLDESGILIYANSSVPVSLTIPHQKVGSNYDSVGIFQQRPSTGWSTIASGTAALSNQAAVAQLMDPAYASEAFFGSPPGSNAPSALRKGLQDVANWQSLPPQVAAQAVQASGDSTGSNYLKEEAQARNLLSQLWDSSPAIALPVAVTGGNSTTSTSAISALCGSGNLSQISGDEHQLAQQILADKNITFDYGPNGNIAKPFQDLANGQQADTAPNSGGTDVSITLLKFILLLSQSHKVNISSLTTSHAPGDVHTTGDAVDINVLDNVHLTGRDAGAVQIITLAEGALPKGSGFGQQGCGPDVTLSAGFIQFPDTCNHLHIQVPKGTP